MLSCVSWLIAQILMNYGLFLTEMFLTIIFILSYVKFVSLDPICVEKNLLYCRAENWKSIFNIQKYVRIFKYTEKENQNQGLQENRGNKRQDQN